MKTTLGNTPGPVTVLRGHTDAVVSLKYARSQHLYSGASNGMMLRWNLATFRADITLTAHEKSIISINELKDFHIVTSSRDSTVKLWDCARFDGPPLSVMRIGYDHFCNSCVSSIDGASVLITPGIKQSQIFVWDPRAPHVPVQVIAPDESVGMVTSLCASTGENSLFAGFEDGSVSAFDLRSAERICFQKVHAEPVFALHAHHSSKGLRLVSGGGDNVINRSLFSATPPCSHTLATTDTINLKQPGTSCVKHRRDGRIVLAAHWDHSVRVFDHKRMKTLAVLKHHRDSVYAVEFLSRDAPAQSTNSDVAVAVADCERREEEDDSGGAARRADNGESASGGGSVLGEGCFATGSKDHTIALWDLFADSYKA